MSPSHPPQAVGDGRVIGAEQVEQGGFFAAVVPPEIAMAGMHSTPSHDTTAMHWRPALSLLRVCTLSSFILRHTTPLAIGATHWLPQTHHLGSWGGLVWIAGWMT